MIFFCAEFGLERVFEVVEYSRATGEALEKCRRLMSELKIHRYWGHCGL